MSFDIFQSQPQTKRPEDRPLHHQPHQHHGEGHRDGVQQVTELRIVLTFIVIHFLNFQVLYCVPCNMRWQPERGAPEPGKEPGGRDDHAAGVGDQYPGAAFETHGGTNELN